MAIQRRLVGAIQMPGQGLITTVLEFDDVTLNIIGLETSGRTTGRVGGALRQPSNVTEPDIESSVDGLDGTTRTNVPPPRRPEWKMVLVRDDDGTFKLKPVGIQASMQIQVGR